jgi:hypothetical protein
VFACAVCNKKFVVRNTLLNHLSSKHGIAIDKPNECSICGKEVCKWSPPKSTQTSALSRTPSLFALRQVICYN